MVKIIKKGNDKLNKIIRFSCPMCETVFDADKNDYAFMLAGSPKELWYYCACPTCENLVYENDIYSSKENR